MKLMTSHRYNNALIFGLISTFLTGFGFTVISPVVPFMVQPFANAHSQALIVTALTAVYAACTFLSAPLFGLLSDRFGRKPILLLSLAGSTLGFLVFGMAHSIGMLFLGRVIDGLTAGNIVTLFAYFADFTAEENRTKIFGWIAASVGVGTISGPVLGGILAHFGNSIPFYFGAAITALNMVYGFFFMPETLIQETTPAPFKLRELNPLAQLFTVFKMKQITPLLFAALLLWLPAGSLQAIISQFSLDRFSFQPVAIGLVFAIMGAQDILTQLIILPRVLNKLKTRYLLPLGVVSEWIGYVLLALSAWTGFWELFVVGMFIFAFGDSIFGTAFNSQLSLLASSKSQGKVQGGAQAIQSLTRVVGPLIGGELYILLGSSAPAILGVLLLICSFLVLKTHTTVKKGEILL